MANAYSTRGGLIKPEVGQNLNTWGQLLNDNAIDLIDKGLFGFEPITVTGDFSLTRTNGDATSTQINKGISLNGTPTADFTVTCLSYEHIILWRNNSGRNATIKVAAGTGVTLANGQIAFLGYNATLGDITLVSPNRIPGDAVIAGALQVGGRVTNMSPGTAGTDAINKNQLDAALALLTTVTSPGTLRNSSTDTTSGFLANKLIGATASGIRFDTQNGGGDEDLAASFDFSTMTAMTQIDPNADLLAIYDASAGTHKSVKPALVADEGNLTLLAQVFA
jgi:hypothetical protein